MPSNDDIEKHEESIALTRKYIRVENARIFSQKNETDTVFVRFDSILEIELDKFRLTEILRHEMNIVNSEIQQVNSHFSVNDKS